jgi:hypothetical protein
MKTSTILTKSDTKVQRAPRISRRQQMAAWKQYLFDQGFEDEESEAFYDRKTDITYEAKDYIL